MSSSKHTPAPWIYQPNIGGSDRPFIGYNIFYKTPDKCDNHYGVNTGGHLKHLADVRRMTPNGDAEANAKLIAAAPDLLVAAKIGLRYMEKIPGIIDLGTGYKTVKDAINKAEAKGE